MRVRLLVLGAIVAGCGGESTPPTPTAAAEIVTVGDIFSPTFTDINVGETVRWSFAAGSDGQGHNVRFNPRITGSPADISVHATGSVTRVFPDTGTFKYDCDVHPGMKGEITVH